MGVWDQTTLAEHLFEAAHTHAERDGRHFGDGADADLRQLAEDGARRLLADTVPDGVDAAIDAAQSNIVRLIDFAIEEASTIDGYDARRLGEITYFPAKVRFCPCYPFC